MAVIELCRKSKGGRSNGPKSDLRVYTTRESGPSRRFSIGLRINETVMRRLRWLVGDYVRASFDDSAMTWTIKRVADKTGNRLSGQGRNNGDGTVRFAIERSDMEAFGLTGDEGYDCSLLDADSDSATFKLS